MRPILPALAACLLLAWSLPPTPAHAQDDDAPSLDDIPHVTALGTATATPAPDIARLTLGVTTQAPTAAEAAKANAASAQHLLEVARAAGVAPGDLTTKAITLNEVTTNTRQPDGTFKPERQGFKAGYLVAIDVRDFTRIGTLMQALIEAGANQFNGVAFRIEHPEATRDRLAAEAMRDARKRAGILADAAGVKLGRLLQVERPDQPAGARPFVREADADLPVAPGTLTFGETVEATYAIEP